LLLPEWLRDGEAPASAKIEQTATEPVGTTTVEVVTEVATIETPQAAAVPATPFSDRLSLDTRLDPGQLVSASDLPAWLGGLERVAPALTVQQLPAAPASVATTTVEVPEPYEEVDAPEDGVVEIEVNGWIMVAAALGLLILLAAALRLYLT
jgi:hypothetical protein